MRDFLVNSVVPFALSSLLVLGVTGALFDVPAEAPVKMAVAPAPAVASSAKAIRPIPTRVAKTKATPTATAPVAPNPARVPAPENLGRPITPPDWMNDVMALAVRTLSATDTPTSNASPLDERTEERGQNTLSALSALTQAVQVARDARDDADLARAEELMRAARTEMEKTCATGGGALCSSATQIRSLGY